MKYTNAREVLPPKLVEILQDYLQGGYLYVPKRESETAISHQLTGYKNELEKRNRHIYTRYLEGRTAQQLAAQYHLSESSIRRILLKQKRESDGVRDMVSDIIRQWNREGSALKQIYHTAWEIDRNYILKRYGDKEAMLRNIQSMKILHEARIPVAELILTADGSEFAAEGEYTYILTTKLRGNNLTQISDGAFAYKMGEIIGRLHLAFQQCEDRLKCWDNSLLEEINGWVKWELEQNNWETISEAAYKRTAEGLAEVYAKLPRQLIHRDVHFGNFLFDKGEFCGYIDFDLTQKNIRIFDVCYFLLGLLTEENGIPLNDGEWIRIMKAVLEGYGSRIKLNAAEKRAIPYVMESIELLFAAYFIRIGDLRCAEDAARIYEQILRLEENGRL